MPRPTRVLFVCAGNICRSPMAEAFMRRLIAARPGLRRVEVYSAGTIAADGNEPVGQTISVMRTNHGLDISSHRARRLRPNIRADLVLTMDREVTREAQEAGVHGQIELIGDFAGSPGEEVRDPYGGTLDDHARCAAQIERLVDAAATRLEREDADGG